MGCGVSTNRADASGAGERDESSTRESGAAQLAQRLKTIEGSLERCRSGALQQHPPPPPPLDAAQAAAVSAWTYDIHALPYEELPALAYNVLLMHSELKGVDAPKLWRFVCTLESHYHADRPFHSFRHAVDVLLATSSLVRLIHQDQPAVATDATLLGALLVAAIAHDTEHPGVMNPYLVATGHPLAALYEGKSVLENHHAACAISLLERPELDFLSPLPADERASFVGAMKDTILATDVSTTLPHVKEFSAKLEEAKSGGGSWFGSITGREESAAAAPLLLHLIIKAADISNPARPLAVYSRWADGVMDEFFTQGDAERVAGRPISMNCDRESVVMSKCQVGFISFLVEPLLKALLAYSPSLQPLVTQLEENKAHYAALAAQQAT